MYNILDFPHRIMFLTHKLDNFNAKYDWSLMKAVKLDSKTLKNRKTLHVLGWSGGLTIKTSLLGVNLSLGELRQPQRGVSISSVRMARWSVWRSPVVLPLSRMEVPMTGARHSSTMPVVRQTYSDSSSFVRSFNDIPGLWKNGVANLYNFWKLDGFRNLHHIMVQNFNTFGPIYRYWWQISFR